MYCKFSNKNMTHYAGADLGEGGHKWLCARSSLKAQLMSMPDGVDPPLSCNSWIFFFFFMWVIKRWFLEILCSLTKILRTCLKLKGNIANCVPERCDPDAVKGEPMRAAVSWCHGNKACRVPWVLDQSEPGNQTWQKEMGVSNCGGRPSIAIGLISSNF